MEKTINLTLSNDIFDRQEDVYAYIEFGKFTNRFSISQQIISKDFWHFLKTEYDVKPENIMVHCDIQKDLKGREERSYKYIVTLYKPYKIMLIFYDEQKVVDSKIYETSEEQEDKIYEMLIYFQPDASDFVNKKILPKFEEMRYQPPKNKTFFLISSGNYGYELRNATVKDLDINIEMNYGKEFINKDKEIIKKLSENKKGLFLFHGAPGTGKCVVSDTIVKVRNKQTGEIEELSIDKFKERFNM